ncbi:MAG TPA: glycosyltransferase family 2 protein [Candidatus Eremiobacteraceae bacterium]|nr:glycosyltransferase family 2 protein [Candidatus Eremiobacteraceae bacterium]
MRVAICIATYKRTALLRDLLAGISHLTFRRVTAPEIEIVVVDNDPAKTAEPVCAASDLPWLLRYVVEENRGIVHARNRAVCEAGVVDFIAFIDDDEVPSPQWLDELLSTQQRFRADVVGGPRVPTFDPNAPEWIKASSLFGPQMLSTGNRFELCSTGNALVRSEVFAGARGFDQRFNLSGGEDTHFWLRVRRTGYSMIWSEEAIAYETVPQERANLAWILRRGYQCGNCWSWCESTLDHRLRARAMRLVKAAAHMVVGAAAVLPCLFMGKAALAHALRRVCLGLGMLTGLAGHKFLAYQNAGTPAISRISKMAEPTKA